MNFASDNWAGAHPIIARSLAAPAGEFGAAYGASDLDRAARDKFSEIFGRDVSVFFVGTGTAANALALAAVNRPGGVAFCHRESHLIIDEGGATEYLTGGARLCPVGGSLGRITPDSLSGEIARYPPDFIHHGQPMAVSITQATEVGTVYSPEQIRDISKVCKAHGVPLHMDGARFANALVALDISPAEMTHRSGVDILSFGATKNGCWCAEALVFFDPAMARDFAYIRKRAAQLFSKSRFIATQFLAYFEDGLWLELAAHANAQAALLASSIERSQRLRLAWERQTNEVFAILKKTFMDELEGLGVRFYPWSAPAGSDFPWDAPGELELERDEVLARFVTSFATSSADLDRFSKLIEADGIGGRR